MSTGCKSSHNRFLDVSRSNGGLNISGWIESIVRILLHWMKIQLSLSVALYTYAFMVKLAINVLDNFLCILHDRSSTAHVDIVFKSNADVSELDRNLPAKKTCTTADVDVMDIDNTSDNDVDAEEELESTFLFVVTRTRILIINM